MEGSSFFGSENRIVLSQYIPPAFGSGGCPAVPVPHPLQGTAVFCLTTHQANVTEVVELRTEDNAGAGYVAMVYTFGPRPGPQDLGACET